MGSSGELFRALHTPGEPLILANAWDAGTARLLVGMGAKAIATSSAAHAFSLGRSDGGTVDRSEAVAHASDLVQAVAVPVSADAEAGYGPSPDHVAQTVTDLCEAGVAGCSIEDIDPTNGAPYGFRETVGRFEAAVDARDRLREQAGDDFVLCARADGLMTGHYDVDEAIHRLQTLEMVGADVLYAPLPPTWDALARIIDSVEAPVNVLVAGAYAHRSYDEFASIGAARLSFGSSLARVAHRAILDAAGPIFGDGSFAGFAASASSAEVDPLLEKGRSGRR